MGPTVEPLNTILAIVFILAVVLFVLAWAVLLGGAGAFIILGLRYRDVRHTVIATPQQKKAASEALRSGRWGLLMCAATLVAYFARQWAGTAYHDEIARGLVPYSAIWWVVSPLTALWLGSIPFGIAGTIMTSRAGLRLAALIKQMSPLPRMSTVRAAQPGGTPRILSVRLPSAFRSGQVTSVQKGMVPMPKPAQIAIGLGVALLQLVAVNIVTFAFSMVVPDLSPDTNQGVFVAVAGIGFSLGIIAVGWLALALGWLKSPPAHLLRAVFAIVGVYVPLVAALVFEQLRTGSPFVFASMVVGILGFHAAGAIRRS